MVGQGSFAGASKRDGLAPEAVVRMPVVLAPEAVILLAQRVIPLSTPTTPKLVAMC